MKYIKNSINISPKLNKVRHLRLTIVLYWLLAFFFIMTPAQGQQKVDFAAVPEPQHSRLISRIDLIIELQHQHQWDDLYDLFSISYTQGESKQDFVNRLQSNSEPPDGTLLNFTPTHIEKQTYPHTEDLGEWIVEGCGEWLERGQRIRQLSYVKAKWERCDWFLYLVQFDIPLHGGRNPCPEN